MKKAETLYEVGQVALSLTHSPEDIATRLWWLLYRAIIRSGDSNIYIFNFFVFYIFGIWIYPLMVGLLSVNFTRFPLQHLLWWSRHLPHNGTRGNARLWYTYTYNTRGNAILRTRQFSRRDPCKLTDWWCAPSIIRLVVPRADDALECTQVFLPCKCIWQYFVFCLRVILLFSSFDSHPPFFPLYFHFYY